MMDLNKIENHYVSTEVMNVLLLCVLFFHLKLEKKKRNINYNQFSIETDHVRSFTYDFF